MNNIELDYILSTKVKIIEEYSKKDNCDIFHIMYLSEGEYKSCMMKKYYGRDLTDIYFRLKELKSPFLPVIYECIFSIEENTTYIIESKIDGKNLETIIQEQGILPEKEAGKIIINICEALKSLHEMVPPIIHRDIKPSNIIISDDGSIKLIDFDAARNFDNTKENDTRCLGTKFYAAPEQYGFGQTSIQTDIFAIGITLQEILTGKVNNHKVIYHGKMKKIIEKCINFDPKNRYSSVHLLEDDISKLYFNKDKRTKNTTMLILSILLTIFVCGCFFFYTKQTDIFVLKSPTENSSYEEKVDSPHTIEDSKYVSKNNAKNFTNPDKITDKENIEENNIPTDNTSSPEPLITENSSLIKESSTSNNQFILNFLETDYSDIRCMIHNNDGKLIYISEKENDVYLNIYDEKKIKLDVINKYELYDLIYNPNTDKLILYVFGNTAYDDVDSFYRLYTISSDYSVELIYEGENNIRTGLHPSYFLTDDQLLLGSSNNMVFNLSTCSETVELGSIYDNARHQGLFQINNDIFTYTYDDYNGISKFVKLDSIYREIEEFTLPETENIDYYELGSISLYDNNLYFFNNEGLIQFNGNTFEVIIPYDKIKNPYHPNYRSLIVCENEIYYYDIDNKKICLIDKNIPY